MKTNRGSIRFAGSSSWIFVSVLMLTLGSSPPVSAQVLDGPDPAQMEDAAELGYRAVEHGLKIPADVEMGAPSSVVWTSQNRLLVFNRGPNPFMEFDANGDFIRSWGQGEYLRPHGMRLDPEGNIWVTDVNNHVVRKMNLDGDVLLTIGTAGKAGDPEDGLLNEPTVKPGKGLGEFGEAHYMTITPAGDIFVADTVKPALHKFVRM